MSVAPPTFDPAGLYYDKRAIDRMFATYLGRSKDYTDTVFVDDVDLSSYLSKSGGTMTGALTLHDDPAADYHAATKHYVDMFAGSIVTGVESVNGQQGIVSISTLNIPEDTNLYWTNDRFDARLAAYTLAGLDTALGGSVSSLDTILQAFGRLENRVSQLDGAMEGDAKLDGGSLFMKFDGLYYEIIPTVTEGIRTISISDTPQTATGTNTAKFEGGALFFKFSGLWYELLPVVNEGIRSLSISDTPQ